MKQLLRKNLSNALGWRTKRKILVIESDDWGSVRTEGRAAYESMKKGGLEMDKSNFTAFDCLETSSDLERLFEVLAKHKDKNGNTAIFTPLCIVANPDFQKIEEGNFENYYFEDLFQSCQRGTNYSQVPALWKEGNQNKLFAPALHGREHLNVKKWMKLLQAENPGIRLAFENKSMGVSVYQGKAIPEYLAAFDPNTPEDIGDYSNIIRDAGRIFSEILGNKPQYFIASNSPEPKSMESDLKEIGIEYLTRYKLHKYPLGNGGYQKEFNWLGKQNKLGQWYLTRNCGFEPSEAPNADTVDQCLKDIEIAFKWHKPAIISSHRVSFVGGVDERNPSENLPKLDALLTKILKRWPEVEFMSSMELGDIISGKKESL